LVCIAQWIPFSQTKALRDPDELVDDPALAALNEKRFALTYLKIFP